MSLVLDKAKVKVTEKYYQTGPVLDQGQTPECVGYAWRGFLAAAPIMDTGGPTADQIYHEAQANDGDPTPHEGSSVRAGAKALSADHYLKTYLWASTPEQARDWLLSDGGGTIVFGTNWYQKMFVPNKAGFVKPGGKVAGGHAFLCIGYSTQRKAFQFLNSWGTGWGLEGRFWISHHDVGRLLAESGEACTATEQLVTPGP